MRGVKIVGGVGVVATAVVVTGAVAVVVTGDVASALLSVVSVLVVSVVVAVVVVVIAVVDVCMSSSNTITSTLASAESIILLLLSGSSSGDNEGRLSFLLVRLTVEFIIGVKGDGDAIDILCDDVDIGVDVVGDVVVDCGERTGLLPRLSLSPIIRGLPVCFANSFSSSSWSSS